MRVITFLFYPHYSVLNQLLLKFFAVLKQAAPEQFKYLTQLNIKSRHKVNVPASCCLS